MRLALFVSLLVIGSARAAFAAAGDIPAGTPLPVSTNWPTGLKELLDRPNRVHGYRVNAEDVFFYSGDAAAFNDFLIKYVVLDGVAAHKLKLLRGPGIARSPWSNAPGVPCDWRVRIAPRPARPTPQEPRAGLQPATVGGGTNQTCRVELDLWMGGNVDFSKLQIPAGVAIDLGEGFPGANPSGPPRAR